MRPLYLVVGIALFVAGCVTTPMEGIVTTADPAKWQVGFQKDFGAGNGYIREFVPKGEKIESWSRLISIEFFEGEKASAKDFASSFAAKRQAQCPGTTFELIESDEYNAYYAFSFPSCMGQESQSEISRAIQGNDGLHRLSYAVKRRELSPAERAEWLTFLRDAYVAKGPHHDRVR